MSFWNNYKDQRRREGFPVREVGVQKTDVCCTPEQEPKRLLTKTLFEIQKRHEAGTYDAPPLRGENMKSRGLKGPV